MAASGDAPADSSLELVRRIQDGDLTAWDALYARHRDRLLLSIRCRLGPALRARLQSEDILQSVMKDAVDDLERFEPRAAHALEHYLHVCAWNKIRSKAEYFGAKKRSGEVPLSASVAEGVAASEPLGYHDAARYERLERGLAAIPEHLREVVILRKIENVSNREAAAVIGKSPEATSKMFARGIARLGALMREDAGRG